MYFLHTSSYDPCEFKNPRLPTYGNPSLLDIVVPPILLINENDGDAGDCSPLLISSISFFLYANSLADTFNF